MKAARSTKTTFHAQCAGTSNSHSQGSDGLLSDRAIAQLFARMQVIFGHKWTSTIDDDATYRLAVAEWKTQLAGLTVHDVSAGLRRMRKRTGDGATWPPTPIEFRQLCKPHREPYERAEFQGNALPQKTASREFARAQMAKIKAELGI